MAEFKIIKPNSEGGIKIYPMKEWLRNNIEYIPSGMDATSSTSRQLLGGLKKLGWTYNETSLEVRLYPPGEEFNDDVDSSIDEKAESDVEDEHGFGLEKQLRDFLSDNIDSIKINGKKLKLFVDQTGRDGVEYHTAVGFIDVLGVDESGDFYVFELKRDRGSDKVVGQVARYMGWVKSTIGKDKNVYGVIVAKQIGSKLRYAASIVPTVFLYEYRVEFYLNEANLING